MGGERPGMEGPGRGLASRQPPCPGRGSLRGVPTDGAVVVILSGSAVPGARAQEPCWGAPPHWSLPKPRLALPSQPLQ